MNNESATYEAISTKLCDSQPLIEDELETASSVLQQKTIEECLPFLEQSENPADVPFGSDLYGLPSLLTDAHISFVQDALGEYPSGYVTMDASRPWTLYWSLLSLHLLGEDVRPYEAR